MKGESRLRNEIKKAFESAGAATHVYHGSPFGERGFSDLFGTYRGRSFYAEVKPSGWEPRSSAERDRHEVQKDFLARQKDAGAFVGVVRSVSDALALLRDVDNALDNAGDK